MRYVSKSKRSDLLKLGLPCEQEIVPTSQVLFPGEPQRCVAVLLYELLERSCSLREFKKVFQGFQCTLGNFVDNDRANESGRDSDDGCKLTGVSVSSEEG